MEFLQSIEQAWRNFQEHEFAPEALLIGGALLTFIAVMKIVHKGLSLAIWVILASLGILSVSYGMTGSGISLPGASVQSISDMVGPGKAISTDLLKTMCGKLSDTPEGVN